MALEKLNADVLAYVCNSTSWLAETKDSSKAHGQSGMCKTDDLKNSKGNKSNKPWYLGKEPLILKLYKLCETGISMIL